MPANAAVKLTMRADFSWCEMTVDAWLESVALGDGTS